MSRARSTPPNPRTGMLSLLNSWRYRSAALLRTALRRRRFESDMDEEIRFHIDQRTDELVQQGVPAKEARRKARVEFGGPESHRDGMRQAFGLRWLDELAADLRYSTRLLRKSPGFTVIAVASLALALGANTTIFSVANQILFERLAVSHPEQLHLLFHVDEENTVFHMNWGSWFTDDDGKKLSDVMTYPVYEQLRQHAPAADHVFAYKAIGAVNGSVNGNAIPVTVEAVSGNYFSEMGTVPQLGRGILPSDDTAPGSGAVVVLSNGLWHSAFGGTSNALGKVIRVDSLPVTVIGVAAPGFTGAQGVQRTPDLFLPLSFIAARAAGLAGDQDLFHSTKLSWISVMTRHDPGQSLALSQTTLDGLFRRAVYATMAVGANESVPHLQLEDGSRGWAQSSRSLRKPIYVLLGLVAAVLLLACANIANLMLARASHRQREMSLRLALGADRIRIFRQALTESLLLAAMGGALGALLGYSARNLLPRLLENSWQHNTLNVPFNWKVFCFTATLTLLTGIVFGAAPAWRAAASEGRGALQAATHAVTMRRRNWTGRSLVAFQLALATLLVVGSGLFLRTVRNLVVTPTGFEPRNLLLFNLQLPGTDYKGDKGPALFQNLEEKISAMPGVQGVASAQFPLIAGWMSNSGFKVEGEPRSTDKHDMYVNENSVGPDFFRVMQIPILAGRSLSPHDTTTSPKVSVINQALARKFFPGRNPIGARFTTSDDPLPGSKGVLQWTEVVGVCGDTPFDSLKNPPQPLHFESYRQTKVETNGGFGMSMIVRSSITPAVLAYEVQQVIQSIDPNLPMIDVRTQEQQIAGTIQQERLFASLTAGFGILALLLACVGIYGIMAYTVSQRTNEIGIRLALGAQRGQVRAMVLREAGLLTVAGVLVGLAAALGCVQMVKSMLYGLKPHDPVSLTVAPLLLLAVALLASWLPAARASRVEPMIALRHE